MHSLLKERKSFGETRCRVCWTQFEKFDSLSPRYVTRVSGTRKDQRLEKYKSNLDISEVPTLSNSRVGPTKRLEDTSDVPKARLGILPKVYTSSKNKATFFSPAEKWVLPSASAREPEEREFVVDSRASMHMVSEKDLNAELETMRTSKSPTTVMMANGEVRTKKEATVHVKQLDLFVTVMFLQETPAVLSLEKLCEERGYTYHWKIGQNPHPIKKGKRIDCNTSNYVPCVVPGISATSSSTTPSSASSPSSSQESTSANRDSVSENRDVETQYQKGIEVWMRSYGETRCTILQKQKKKESEGIQRDISHELPCLTGHRNSERIWLTKVLPKSVGETWCGEVHTLPVRLMILQWSREHTWNQVPASTVYLRTFRRIRIVKYAWRPK